MTTDSATLRPCSGSCSDLSSDHYHAVVIEQAEVGWVPERHDHSEAQPCPAESTDENGCVPESEWTGNEYEGDYEGAAPKAFDSTILQGYASEAEAEPGLRERSRSLLMEVLHNYTDSHLNVTSASGDPGTRIREHMAALAVHPDAKQGAGDE